MPPGSKYCGLNTEVGNGWHRMWGTRWLLRQHGGRQRQRSATDGKQRAGHRGFQKDAQGSGGRGSLQEDLREEHPLQGACRKTWERSMHGREPAGRLEWGACMAVWGHSSGLWETQSDSGETCFVQTLKYEKHIFMPNNSMVNSRALFWSQKYLKITPFFVCLSKMKERKVALILVFDFRWNFKFIFTKPGSLR